ncbi:phosphatase PAP2 family protein [Cognatilysobacter lacus]|nr:phosphatase PAP2 family protein [Lysobacter lacus]
MYTAPAARPGSRLVTILWWLGLVAFVASTFYPTDLASYASRSGISSAPRVARFMEDYGRYINPVLQGTLPIVLGDRQGMIELAKIAVTATLATHLLKHSLNDVRVNGTRLGERPPLPAGQIAMHWEDTNFNMPSGHSSLASSGAYFVSRRYGWKLALLVVPIMLLTMFARVSLDKHTVSAVISGALLGILVTALMTTRWRGRRQVELQLQ